MKWIGGVRSDARDGRMMGRWEGDVVRMWIFRVTDSHLFGVGGFVPCWLTKDFREDPV
jgi:hypothetical protein